MVLSTPSVFQFDVEFVAESVVESVVVKSKSGVLGCL